MNKLLIFVLFVVLLMPGIALAEGETVTPSEIEVIEPDTPEVITEGEEQPLDEIPPDEIPPEEIPEAENNTIVITDAEGNTYTITAGTITDGTEPETEQTASLEGEAETAAIVDAIIAQGINIDGDTLKAALTEIGLDTAGVTATIKTAAERPLLTTPFADYTVLEGMMLIMCMLFILRMILKLFAL